MSSWVDIKYANLVSIRLERYKIKSYNPYVSNFRCPLCGDSKKSKIKARGGFFQKQDAIIFKCFNCGAGRNISSFLRDVDPELHKQYLVEAFIDKEKKPIEEDCFKHPIHLKAGSPLLKLKKISQLKWDHPAKQYVLDRKIPNKFHSKLFYCSKFAAWTNTMIPGKLKTDNDSPRLIIPFLDKDGRMFGYQGRSFDPNDKLRYITIMLEDRLKTFGLDDLDHTKKYYILEGPIDSMFIPNSIAMAGADMNNKEFLNNNAVFVYDNEPRNIDIVKRVEKVINSGYSVCIWPAELKYKDINDMILCGISADEVKNIIDSNIYNGLAGLIKFNKWKKI